MTTPTPENEMTVESAKRYEHLFVLIMDPNIPKEVNERAFQAYGFLQGHERGVREERERVKPLVEAARGLSFGTDWNNGTHAKLHGYRQKLLDALEAYQSKGGERNC
jgi:hypothetical protein